MRNFGYILSVSMVTGILTFYLAGGIGELSKDVGESGAWVVFFIYQIAYIFLYLIGFCFIFWLSREFDLFKPSLLSVIASSMLLSVGVNLYGIYRVGPGVDFYIFAILIVFLSTVLYGLIACLANIYVKNT